MIFIPRGRSPLQVVCEGVLLLSGSPPGRRRVCCEQGVVWKALSQPESGGLPGTGWLQLRNRAEALAVGAACPPRAQSRRAHLSTQTACEIASSRDEQVT